MNDDLLVLFRKTGALLDGHFVLRSGLHRRQFLQCALLLQHTEIAADVCGRLADKLRDIECDAVISPALGGIIVGQEARSEPCRAIGLARSRFYRPCRRNRRSVSLHKQIMQMRAKSILVTAIEGSPRCCVVAG